MRIREGGGLTVAVRGVRGMAARLPGALARPLLLPRVDPARRDEAQRLQNVVHAQVPDQLHLGRVLNADNAARLVLHQGLDPEVALELEDVGAGIPGTGAAGGRTQIEIHSSHMSNRLRIHITFMSSQEVEHSGPQISLFY